MPDGQFVRVVLRRFRDGNRDVIALFPDEVEGPGLVESYMHVGQHGAASRYLARATDPVDASDPDAVALLSELRSIGYAPILLCRMPHAAA